MTTSGNLIDLTRELLKFGHAEASEWDNRHRYKAAEWMWQEFSDVLECERRESPNGGGVIVMVHNPPPWLEGDE